MKHYFNDPSIHEDFYNNVLLKTLFLYIKRIKLRIITEQDIYRLAFSLRVHSSKLLNPEYPRHPARYSYPRYTQNEHYEEEMEKYRTDLEIYEGKRTKAVDEYMPTLPKGIWCEGPGRSTLIDSLVSKAGIIAHSPGARFCDF